MRLLKPFARLRQAKTHLRSVSIALLPHSEQVKVDRALTALEGLDDDMVMQFRAAELARIDASRAEASHHEFVNEMLGRFGVSPTQRENLS